MPGFSLDRVARPAKKVNGGSAGVSGQHALPSAAPKKASEIIEGPRPPKIRKKQATAECVVAIYPYTRDASTVWELCANTPGLTLWQVQMEHNVTANSLTVGFYESFTKFLEQNEDTPDTLRELSEQAMIKLVLADRNAIFVHGLVRLLWQGREINKSKRLPASILTMWVSCAGELHSTWLARPWRPCTTCCTCWTNSLSSRTPKGRCAW